jgi:hypothetical protein
MKTIVICTSANFYPQAIEAQAALEKMGYKVVIPKNAEKMKANQGFVAKDDRTWLTNPKDYYRKAAFMRAHFDEVAKGDAVLVLNYEKNGKQNYIGGNVLMEMAVGFHLKQPIIILNEAPEDSAYLEEILGMEPTLLHGELEAIQKTFKP